MLELETVLTSLHIFTLCSIRNEPKLQHQRQHFFSLSITGKLYNEEPFQLIGWWYTNDDSNDAEIKVNYVAKMR